MPHNNSNNLTLHLNQTVCHEYVQKQLNEISWPQQQYTIVNFNVID